MLSKYTIHTGDYIRTVNAHSAVGALAELRLLEEPRDLCILRTELDLQKYILDYMQDRPHVYVSELIYGMSHPPDHIDTALRELAAAGKITYDPHARRASMSEENR